MPHRLLGVADRGRRQGPTERLERVHRLVGLLEQVPGEREVCLLAVPGAGQPQGSHELFETGHLPGDGRSQPGNPQRRQVVGLENPVDLPPAHGDHTLVGQPEVVEHRRVGLLTQVLDTE